MPDLPAGLHWWHIAAAVAVLYAAGRLARRLLSRPDPHTTTTTCSCGWSGQVSRHRPRCPRCGCSLAP